LHSRPAARARTEKQSPKQAIGRPPSCSNMQKVWGIRDDAYLRAQRTPQRRVSSARPDEAGSWNLLNSRDPLLRSGRPDGLGPLREEVPLDPTLSRQESHPSNGRKDRLLPLGRCPQLLRATCTDSTV
jgi:hypothetical protein